MNSNIRYALTGLIICIFILLPQAIYCKQTDNIDVVLVMDSSGSMKKTDPLTLRVPAAKLFISLLDRDDRASVVSFSNTGYPIVHLTRLDNEENKDKLFKAIDKITSTGPYTNLVDAFNAGMEVLSRDKQDDREQIIVLMSDGMMDVGNPEEDQRLIENMKTDLTDIIKNKGIRVYAIAFTRQSERKLLEKISKKTGGFYNFAPTDKDFHLIFSSIFESLKSPEMIPMDDNAFQVDQSIKEVTIVATKETPETEIQINAPGGQRYTNRNKYSGIGWFTSNNFDMITVERPVEGKWEILFSTEKNNKAYVITNLKLRTNFEQLYSIFGEPMEVRLWLEKNEETIKEQAVLDKINIYIEIKDPDGDTTRIKPFYVGEGIFMRKVTPFTPGNYKMKMVAKGMTFEREKSFVFKIANVKESKEDLKAMNSEEKPGQSQRQQIEGNDEKNSISWLKVIVQLILANLFLGLMALLYFKRKNLKNIKGLKGRAFIINKIICFIKRSKGNEGGEDLKVTEPGRGESAINNHVEISDDEEFEKGSTQGSEAKAVYEENSEEEEKDDEKNEIELDDESENDVNTDEDAQSESIEQPANGKNQDAEKANVIEDNNFENRQQEDNKTEGNPESA